MTQAMWRLRHLAVELDCSYEEVIELAVRHLYGTIIRDRPVYLCPPTIVPSPPDGDPPDVVALAA